MSAISSDLRQILEADGFTIESEGKQTIPPLKESTVTLSDCLKAGAKKHGIDRILEVKTEVNRRAIVEKDRWRMEKFNAGHDIFVVFDSVVTYKESTGLLSFMFTYWNDGMLNLSDTSVGYGPFTPEMASKATQLQDA